MQVSAVKIHYHLFNRYQSQTLTTTTRHTRQYWHANK